MLNPIKNLAINMTNPFAYISQNYHIETVAKRRYLINKQNGHISTLNDSAEIILDLLKSGLSIAETSSKIAEVTRQPSQQIGANIQVLLNDLAHKETAEIIPRTYLPSSKTVHQDKPVCVQYLINQHLITINYSSQSVYEENHALLQPMATTTNIAPKHTIDIFDYDARAEIHLDGKPYIGTSDVSWLNGLLRNCIIQCAYPNLNSALVLHAAGLSKNNKTLLFTGPSGAGKSTLSSHFLLNGYQYLGDDSIPIDLDSNEAFALPTAISLKAGSWELFHQHKSTLAHSKLRREFDKPMKTLCPDGQSVQANKTSIAALIFSQYDANSTNSLESIDLDQALYLIQQAETKFNPDTIGRTPKALLHWLNVIPKYTLTYKALAFAQKSADELISNTSN